MKYKNVIPETPGSLTSKNRSAGEIRGSAPFLPVRVAVAPHKFERGFRGDNLSTVRSIYRVRELRAALEAHHASDAHLVAYVVAGAVWQPRINKDGLPVFPREVYLESFFCDADNPGHASWDEDLEREALREFDTLDVLESTGVYHTRRGRRIVQPLAQRLPMHQAEPALGRWLVSLEVAGLEVDWACRDWTRHFRLPHVVRDGVCEEARVLRLERMRPLVVRVPDLEEQVPSPTPPPASGVRVAEPRGPRYGHERELRTDRLEFDWTTTIDPSWKPAIDRIASAVRRVETEWHSLFLAIAGALLARGAEPEDLPLLCRAISEATGADDRPRDRELIGRSTAERSVMGMPVAGLSTLQRRWPVVAAAFEPETPLRFRELAALLQVFRSSRVLAETVGVERAEVQGWLRGEPIRSELRAALRSLLRAHVLDGQEG
jgi:hypothetical protein